MLYGGVQKNIGPAGVVIAVDPGGSDPGGCAARHPTIACATKTHADNGSMYIPLPPTHLHLRQGLLSGAGDGGLEVMKERNEKKAAVLYEFPGRSELFHRTVVKKDRSLMNVPFVTETRSWTPS